jgi:hypothetical protein
MKNGKYIYLIFIIAFCYACGSRNSNDNLSYTELSIDNSNIEKITDISDKVGAITIVPLKETKGNFIGGVFKLYIVNNKYIVYDRLNTNRINLFDSTGAFIKTIIKIGDGPNDPISMVDCWVNDKDELEVYDFAQMKIFRFDTSFTLVKTIKSPELNHFVALKPIPNTDKYIAYANFNDFNPPFRGKLYHIAWLNNELNIENTDRYFDKKFQGIPWLVFNEHFYNYKDTLRFIKSYDNFVYNITNAGVRPRYKIAYKENPLPDDVLPIVNKHLSKFKDMNVTPNEKAAYLKNYVRFNGQWLENDKYIYLTSRDAQGQFGTIFHSLVDKKNNSTLFNSQNICDTKKYKLTIPPFQYCDNKNQEFIAVTNGEKLKSMLYKDSPLQQEIIDDPEIFYIVKVKFN